MLPRPVENLWELIGNTPLVRLARLEKPGSAAVYAKLEVFNPGGSIKDRIALAMIRRAEAAGLLRPGMTIIEPTAGNTGVGLALLGPLLGYRTILVVPAKFSLEKLTVINAFGGEVVVTPLEAGMEGAIEKAEEIFATLENAYMPQQFTNPDNPDAHYLTTGPEVWEQLQGRVDAIALGAGTGGTFTGMARFLKERNPACQAWLVDPEGSILGGGPRGPYRVEGIGSHFIPEVMEMGLVDGVITVGNEESFEMARELARRAGILAGGSSGANVLGALRVAEGLGAGKNVVTVLPDGGERYISKGIFQIVEPRVGGGGRG